MAGPVGASVTSKKLQLDPDSNKVEVVYWYGLGILKAGWLLLYGFKMSSKSTGDPSIRC